MKRFNIACFVFFILLLTDKTFAQLNLYPAHSGQIPFATGMMNSALQPASGKVDFASSNQFFSNQFSQVRNLSLTGSVSVQKNDTALLRQRLGLKIVNEIEGEFISRPKFYLTYTWSRLLFQNFRLTAGANFGRANYTYHATQVSPTSTAGNWDGLLGIAADGKHFRIGFSINQIFNSTFTPLNREFRWKSFPSFYFEKSFVLSPHLSTNLFVLSTILKNASNRHDLGVNVLISQKLLAGLNYYLSNSISFTAGIIDINKENQHLSFFLTYTHPFSQQISINVQTFEIGLHYFFKKQRLFSSFSL